jgi:hypothetical protein
MIFNSKEEALKSKDKYILFKEGEDDTDLFNNHFKRYEYFNNDKTPNIMGQYFLYELHLSNEYGGRADSIYKNILTYPRLGVYINSLPCDQTIEIEWVNPRRTWEWNSEYKYNHDGKEYMNYVGELPTEIVRLPLWGDSMLIYDVWDSKPNWKQLRQAYERTWWFWRSDEEKRNLQLNRILGNV